MSKTLIISNLHASIEDNQILRGVNLTVPPGEVHALMGPNGSGKSTLANCLMGNPAYTVTDGSVTYGGVEILELAPDERAREGLFLAFQYPQEIPGVKVTDFLRTAVMAVHAGKVTLAEFMDRLEEAAAALNMDKSYLSRSLNEGFSGGEKKRAEVLQMLMLRPTLAILDETDSGLDIDALKIVASGVNSLRGKGFSALIITHYQRILNYLEPDKVHVMHRGRIALSGGSELAHELEERGYEILREDGAVLAG